MPEWSAASTPFSEELDILKLIDLDVYNPLCSIFVLQRKRLSESEKIFIERACTIQVVDVDPHVRNAQYVRPVGNLLRKQRRDEDKQYYYDRSHVARHNKTTILGDLPVDIDAIKLAIDALLRAG